MQTFGTTGKAALLRNYRSVVSSVSLASRSPGKENSGSFEENINQLGISAEQVYRLNKKFALKGLNIILHNPECRPSFSIAIKGLRDNLAQEPSIPKEPYNPGMGFEV